MLFRIENANDNKTNKLTTKHNVMSTNSTPCRSDHSLILLLFCCTGFHRRCSLSKSIAIRRSEISAPYITHFIASAGFRVCGFWIIFGKWTPVKSQSWSDPFEKPGDISNLISCVRVSESFFSSGFGWFISHMPWPMGKIWNASALPNRGVKSD